MVYKKWVNSTRTRAYVAWRNMRRRCENPCDKSFKHYGAKGITVCVEWANNFDSFVEDMGHPPTGTSLDRIDNEKGYFPGNCRWTTISEQMNNRSDNVRIGHNGLNMTMTQWAKALGVKADTLHKRLLRMPASEALVKSRKRGWKHGTRRGYEVGCRCRECKDTHAKRFRDRRATREGY